MSYDKYIPLHKYNITSNIICMYKYPDRANIYVWREVIPKFHPDFTSELSLFSTLSRTSSQISDLYSFLINCYIPFQPRSYFFFVCQKKMYNRMVHILKLMWCWITSLEYILKGSEESMASLVVSFWISEGWYDSFSASGEP